VVLGVTIHDGEARRQNFGMVARAYVRCLNGNPGAANNSEIARYDLSEDSSTETAMIFGEVYRNGADWKFRAVGQGFNGGLGPLAQNYGVNV
jgi:tellurium resistance protein TerD